MVKIKLDGIQYKIKLVVDCNNINFEYEREDGKEMKHNELLKVNEHLKELVDNLRNELDEVVDSDEPEVV